MKKGNYLVHKRLFHTSKINDWENELKIVKGLLTFYDIFFYAQLTFAFYFQKGFYIFHEQNVVFLLLLFKKYFDAFHVFFLYFLREQLLPIFLGRAISMATSRMATNEMAADRVVLIE